MKALARASAPPTDPAEVLRRARKAFEALSPELQRAARWMCDHSSDVALLSMRQQAIQAGVSAPTMVRLARVLGFADYASLRRPFREAIAGGSVFGRRASALQSTPAASRTGKLARKIVDAQIGDVQSVQVLNKPAAITATAEAIARARRVGFLGVRASFSIAFYFRYAYSLIATNGVLFDGLGGFLLDQAEALERGDVLVAVSQLPYSAPTVLAVEAARQRGVKIIAFSDSAMSPLARRADHTLLFGTESLSFFPSMIAPLALVELLLAQLAARGGKKVLNRLAEVERRLAASHAYWRETGYRARA